MGMGVAGIIINDYHGSFPHSLSETHQSVMVGENPNLEMGFHKGFNHHQYPISNRVSCGQKHAFSQVFVDALDLLWRSAHSRPDRLGRSRLPDHRWKSRENGHAKTCQKKPVILIHIKHMYIYIYVYIYIHNCVNIFFVSIWIYTMYIYIYIQYMWIDYCIYIYI